MNVINGDYCDESVTDLAITGPDALILQRFYNNKDAITGIQAGGWRIFPPRFLVVGKDPSGKSCTVGKDRFEWTSAFVGERSWGILRYRGWRNKDPTSLKVPLIRVKLSANVAQTGPNSFHKNFMETLKMLKQKDPKGFTSTETKWGDYPVLAVRSKPDGKLNFSAWVGLNDPEAGWTLVFSLVYPDKKGRPNKKDRQLWESLLTKTTPLKDGDFFKACGQDLQEGYTLVNVGGAKLKMLAEKRQSDGTVQVVVIPENSDCVADIPIYLNEQNKTTIFKEAHISRSTANQILKHKNPTIKTLAKIVSTMAA